MWNGPQRAARPVLSLPTLDDPAPQMVGQLLNLAQFFDTLLSDDVPMRTPVREPQLAEQLVEVPELSADFTSSTPAAHVDSLAVVELLDNFKQLSGQVGNMDRRSKHVAKESSSDIDMLYRFITEARHRLQQLKAWADEVAGDDDGPGDRHGVRLFSGC